MFLRSVNGSERRCPLQCVHACLRSGARWLVAVQLVLAPLGAQPILPPAVEWEAHFGGLSTDGLFAVQPTRDGGFIAGGYSWPGTGGTKSEGGYGGSDFWVVRVDSAGNQLWDRSYGGDRDDVLAALAQTDDGGFILGGRSESGPTGNKTSPNRGSGSHDFWVVRTDADGNKLWDRSFGGGWQDELTVLQQTFDGGFILGGTSSSEAGGLFGNKSSRLWGGVDWWVVRLDATGNLLWDQSFGGSRNESVTGIEQTPDGGFLLSGSSSSVDGNKTSRSFGADDFWVVRIDANGTKLWDRTYGGSRSDGCFGLHPTGDGGFVLVGVSGSPDDGNKSSLGSPSGANWIWLVRIDAAGTNLWDQTVPKGEFDSLRVSDRTPDGGFILGGLKPAAGGWGSDYWVVRLEANAARVWERVFPGGAAQDAVYAVRALNNGAFLVGGTRYYSAASFDFRLLKLAPERYTLSLSTNFPGRGTIQATPPGFDGKYTGGTTVTLTALPEPGHEFSFWNTGRSDTQNPVQILMNGNQRVTADFAVTTGSPAIGHSPLELSLLGGDAVCEATLQIWNVGGGTLRYALSPDQSWIGIAPASAASVGETNLHQVKFAVASLPPGVHRGAITIQPQELGLAPERIAVTLRIQAGQSPRVEWQRTLGGSDDDGAFCVVETTDGGFLVGASSLSTNGNRSAPYLGGADFWIIRLDSFGAQLWDRSFGGANDETLWSLQQTGDGGFILGGWTQSGPSGNKTSPSFGSVDYWLVRVDTDGHRLWDTTLGGSGGDYLYGVAQTADGGFAAAGESFSTNGTRTAPRFGSSDYWFVRTDANGTPLWDRSYGGNSVDACLALDLTAEAGFVLGGLSGSVPGTGTKSSPRFSSRDYWVVRTDASGNPQWDASFGSTNLDALFALKTLPEGYILGGRAHGLGGNRTAPDFGNGDYWLVRIDSAGNKVWDRSFGSDNYDELHTLATTSDGGFLLGGWSQPGTRGNRTSGTLGGTDFWVLRTDAAGNKLWEQNFGTEHEDYLYSVQQTRDGGFILAGYSWPTNENASAEVLLIKLAPEAPRLRADPGSGGLSTNGFSLSVLGESNQVYVTEYSLDLKTWQPLATNTAPDVELRVLDRGAPGAPSRFYRARRPPP